MNAFCDLCLGQVLAVCWQGVKGQDFDASLIPEEDLKYLSYRPAYVGALVEAYSEPEESHEINYLPSKRTFFNGKKKRGFTPEPTLVAYPRDITKRLLAHKRTFFNG